MKRILLCASRSSHILNFHLPYLASFKEQGCIVDVAAEGRIRHPLVDHSYDLRFVKNPLSPQNLSTVRQLTTLMRQHSYSLVCSNATLAGAAARSAAARLKEKRPYMVHISHGYMFGRDNGIRSVLYRTVEKHLAGVTDALVVMNREDYALARDYHLAEHLYFINGMGLCPQNFPTLSPQETESLRRRLHVSDSTRLLLCVGELSGRKNQTLLLRAFDRLHRQHPDMMLLFAGNGKALAECVDLTRRLELTHWVRFLGHQKDVNALYRSADLLVSAAVMEGLPFNVMEALYCGLPVVASDIKGHHDLIHPGENGLLFDLQAADPVAAAARAMEQALFDPKLSVRLRSHALLDNRYTIGSVRPRLWQILTRQTDEIKTEIPEEVYP